jgi:hypothetical protein
MEEVDDSKYYTPKLIQFDSGLFFGLWEIIIIAVVVSLMVAAWYMRHRAKQKYATRADVAGFLPKKKKRRRRSQ